MARMNKFLGLLIAFALAALALPASADDDNTTKKYKLDIKVISQPTATSAATVTAVFTNLNNSSFNSLTLSLPATGGYQILTAKADKGTTCAGTAAVACTAPSTGLPISTGSIKVTGINLPVGSGQVVTVTMTVAPTTNTCAAVSGSWTAQPWTGSALTGNKFTLVTATTPPTSQLTTINPACYTLKYNAGSCASISPPSAASQTVLASGSGSPATAVPLDSWHFVKWSDNVSTATRTDSSSTNVSAICAINSHSFTVSKAYSTDTPAASQVSVSVGLQCSSGTPTSTPLSAGPGSAATFTVTGYSNSGTPNCTATESPVPTGFTTSSATCTDTIANGSCTITNNIKHFNLTYNAGTGGTLSSTLPSGPVTGVAQVIQDVIYNGTGTAVTAAESAGYRWIGWTDSNASRTRTDADVTGNLTFGAVFGGTLSFTTPPHDALAGGLVGPVVVACNNFSTGSPPTVTLSIDWGGLTGTGATQGTVQQPCANGKATFSDVGTTLTTPPGTRTFTATTNEYATGTAATTTWSIAITADTGTLACWTGPGVPPAGDASNFSATVTGHTTNGYRLPNKIVSSCVVVPYAITLSNNNRTVEVVYDEEAQPNAVLYQDTTWPPELVANDGLLAATTKYNLTPGVSAHPELGTWYTAPHCISPNAPVQIGTLGQPLDAATADGSVSIAISFSTTPTFPLPIVIASDQANTDPERMLVTALITTGPDAGKYSVTRKALGSTSHANSVAVMSTPLPISKDASNGPVGFPVAVCLIEETSSSQLLSACDAQSNTEEPLACITVRSKLYLIGDVGTSRGQ